MPTSMENDREAIIRTLAQVYAMEGRKLEVEILAKSEAELEQIEYDNWNGGTYTYALKLQVSPVLYTRIGQGLDDIEKDMLKRLGPLLRAYSNEYLGQVMITMQLEHEENWRDNAMKWLNEAEDKDGLDTDVRFKYDAFISHATEDKPELVRPLAEELVRRGSRIWYDEFTLKVGDSLRQSIDMGLAASRFGIVVLSKAFFSKNWPQYELDGLVARQGVGYKVILPIWHGIARDDIIAYSPSLADKLALDSANKTIPELSNELASVLKGNK